LQRNDGASIIFQNGYDRRALTACNCRAVHVSYYIFAWYESVYHVTGVAHSRCRPRSTRHLQPTSLFLRPLPSR